MIEFFRRVTQFRAPKDPLEGALKLLLWSQLITVPITEMTDSTNVIAHAYIINTIHFSALLIGTTWGAVNKCSQTEDRNPHHLQLQIVKRFR